MAARHWDEQAVKRLGKLMERRREELDPRYHVRKVFAAERGIHLRKAADLENGWRRDFPPLTLKEEFAPAYAVTFESVLSVLEEGGDLEALPGTPLHKIRRPRLAALPDPEPDAAAGGDDFPLKRAMKATPGHAEYLARVDAERDSDHLTEDPSELRIWADLKMTEDTKRVLIAYRRLVADATSSGSSEKSAGLRRIEGAAL